MKSITKKLQYVLVAALILGATAAMANTNLEENKTNISVSADELLGAWVYTVENVPYEYSKGVFLISKEKGAYNVQVQLSHGTLTGEDIEVKGNTVKFNLFIEGQSVSVELTSNRDKISGESNSMDGTCQIEGNRQAQPE
jgi:hypothetical protein